MNFFERPYGQLRWWNILYQKNCPKKHNISSSNMSSAASFILFVSCLDFHAIQFATIFTNWCSAFIKVDQHSVLNGLNHEDSAIKWDIYILRVKKWRRRYMLTYSFFCYCTSTKGTYHRQFWKCVRFSMFRSWAKILLFLSNKTFQVLENIHITK